MSKKLNFKKERFYVSYKDAYQTTETYARVKNGKVDWMKLIDKATDFGSEEAANDFIIKGGYVGMTVVYEIR